MKNSKTTCYPTFTKAWIPLLGIITALTFSCSGSNFLSNKTPRPFTGLAETGTFFSPVPRNQGFTHDGKYWYISPDHSTIEKRRLDDFELIESATHPDKIGGLFYDPIRDEILTCSGEYKWGGKAFISRINKDNLEEIEHIDISAHTKQGVNAIVRLGDKIYVGETAVGSSNKPKSWYEFDMDFNFVDTVYTHITNKGEYDWQDATVIGETIYATDHEGFVYAFHVARDGKLISSDRYDSSGGYMEGITQKNNQFYIWKKGTGIVTAELKE